MKPVLTGSLALNAALLGLICWRGFMRVEIPARVPMESPRSASAPGVRIPSHLDVKTDPWQPLASGDYPAAIERLRGLGCPEETLQRIIVVAVSGEYAEKIRAVAEVPYKRAEWWKRFDSEGAAWYRQRERLRLRLEMFDRAEELLGVPFQELTRDVMPYGRQAPDPWTGPEKKAAAEKLTYRLKDETANLVGPPIWQRTVALDASQKAALAALKLRQQTELAALLSPEELAAYNLRYSDAANYARISLPAAKSEAEFAALVRAARQAGVEEIANQIRFPNDEARAALEQTVSQIIGAERSTLEAKAKADREAEQDAEMERQSRSREEERVIRIGAEFGIQKAQFDQFRAGLTARLKELEAKTPDSSTLSEAQQHQLEAQMRQEIQTLAKQYMGPKGVHFLETLDHWPAPAQDAGAAVPPK